ncbi:MAG: baseplate J/gp47 family protein [Candidatus Binataceae bacterium]
MNNQPICPCDRFVFPTTIFNPPGLSSIAYRVGDFTSFRHALLLPHADETELVNWRPSAPQDLAVQMAEWWAYLADILTFYNERIANQDYLRTADLPESVNRLIRVLGYRPRPSIGATGVLAALLTKQLPLDLPQGFQIQSKPGPGEQPQIFELDADTTISPLDATPVDFAPKQTLLQTDSSGASSVLLAGAISGVKPGDELLLLKRNWAGETGNGSLAVASAVTQQNDAHGAFNTQISFASPPTLPVGAVVTDYRLLQSNQFARPWQYADPSATLQQNSIDLDSIVRAIKVGDPVLLEIPGGAPTPQLVSVSAYTEAVWYANAERETPCTAPGDRTIPIPIPHSRIAFPQPNQFAPLQFIPFPLRFALTSPQISFAPPHDQNWLLGQLEVRYGWRDVGQLIPTPAQGFEPTTPTLVATPPASLPAASNVPVMVEDANGIGESAFASVGGTPPTMQLSGLPDQPMDLMPPLRVLYGLMQVSRGKTVTNEILGSGDATQAGQEFVLKNAPLTYLLGASSISGQNYRSTLIVRVDGIAWREVPSFYGQAVDARIFVTREDENNQTHVMFGDGVNAARLPSGVNNVVATYRYGGGAKSPSAGSLTVILQPQPNLKAIRNPVAVGGGADADPPGQIRRYAPQSALTFGRAISADDYETIAAQAPGVARARSYWAFDPDQQRALVTIYVGDDATAVTAAKTAIALAEDPNRPVAVKLATPVPVRLGMTLLIDPKYDAAAVIAGVRSALLDPQTGLLGASLRIGQTIYKSQIYQACLNVPGAVAIHGLWFIAGRFIPLFRRFGFSDATERYSPGVGGFFQLTDLAITPEAADNA